MTEPHLFDRPLILARRRRALRAATAGADFLAARVIDDMADRLAVVSRRFPVAAVLDDPTGRLTQLLASSSKVGQIIRLDPLAAAGDPLSLVGREDALPFATGALDLAISALTLHTLDDLPGTLVQIRRCLRPDGLFMAALPGGDTLTELREALAAAEVELTGGLSPRVVPFLDVRDMGGLLQRAGFALPVTDSDRVTVRYASMFALIRDLRAMGATNPLVERSRKPTSRHLFLRAAEIYASRFADADGRIRATFQIISASGWSPSDSQPKPLKPGSAAMRLADALGTQERTPREIPE